MCVGVGQNPSREPVRPTRVATFACCPAASYSAAAAWSRSTLVASQAARSNDAAASLHLLAACKAARARKESE